MNYIELDGKLINLDTVCRIDQTKDGSAELFFEGHSDYFDVKYDSIKEAIGEMQPYGLFRRGRR